MCARSRSHSKTSFSPSPHERGLLTKVKTPFAFHFPTPLS